MKIFTKPFKASLLQPQASSIVRHLKSGLYFTLSIMEGQSTASESLLAHKLQSKLLKLFDEPHMAVTLKVILFFVDLINMFKIKI